MKNLTNIPNTLLDFFKDPPNTLNFKDLNIPKFKNKSELTRWLIWESGLPYFPLLLPNAPYQDMLKEAIELDMSFVNHRVDEYLPFDYINKGWSSVCLHGEEWWKTESYKQYPENVGKNESEINYKWCSEISDKCPITVDYFKNSFPASSYSRVRFMKLSAGGYILPHKDRDRSMLMPVNIALNNPQGCIFRMENKGDVPFNADGGACLVDISNTHSIWNNSDTDRIHIIVHFVQDVRIEEIIYNSLNSLLN